MITRDTRPEMGKIWSEENKFRKWLQVEIAVCETLAELGEIPSEAVAEIKEKADFSLTRIQEIEEITRHDLIAFTTAVAETVGDHSRFIHFGLTSTDVVDTAQAIQIREASDLIEEELLNLISIVKSQALRYQHLPMIGRTHGMHAEPITLGLKLIVWYSELNRSLERFRQARKNLQVGKISGPVGTFSYLPPQVEENVCKQLGLSFAQVSTQTLQRDRHAEYLCVLAILGSTYDKIATEIRHLQRTEVREAAEAFAKGQKGSSAMPHKQNPITCEQISGLSRVLRGNALVSLENIPLWHERDISHSSVERIILPDSTTLSHYLTIKLSQVIQNLQVNKEEMERNLKLSGGLIFSGALLLALTRKGVLREQAYEWVQRNSARTRSQNGNFQQLILKDPDIKIHLSSAEIHAAFNIQDRLKYVDAIFKRVLGPS
jgi:adenylosuccinate lyase